MENTKNKIEPKDRRVFRKYKRSNFVMIDRGLCDKTSGLSPVSFRVLCFALSKPDDWNLTKERIMEGLDMKESQVRKATDELQQLGYLVISKYKTDSGWGTAYRWYEDVNESPSVSKYKDQNQE